jgi:UDP-N-acetylmuramate dehydrogenase
MTSFKQAINNAGLILQSNQSLAAHTTLKVGGNATYLVKTENSDQLYNALNLAIKFNQAFVILGKGSNIIVSDEGFKGLVILCTSTKWELINEDMNSNKASSIAPRFETEISGFEHENVESDLDGNVLIRVDSGVAVNYLMHQLYKKDISGLEWYTGIPATIGGAIYMNMHGGEYFFGDLVYKAKITDGMNIRTVDKDYFRFDYDWSILHQTKEVILSADLVLKRGDTKLARQITNEWARHKAQQPRKSAGCIFKNLPGEIKDKLNLPTTSVGYLIDKVLSLKGKRIGDAIISEKHAAFIENLGNASARDVYDLMQLVKTTAYAELGIKLEEEVQLVGKF